MLHRAVAPVYVAVDFAGEREVDGEVVGEGGFADEDHVFEFVCGLAGLQDFEAAEPRGRGTFGVELDGAAAALGAVVLVHLDLEAVFACLLAVGFGCGSEPVALARFEGEPSG